MSGTQNTTVELHVKHSKFLNNTNGITCIGNGGGFSEIDTTEFMNNDNSSNGAQIIFTGCIMRNNISGIFIQPFAFTYTYINSCIINSNQFGITGSAATGASFYSIRNSTIDSNSVAGIVLGDYPSYIDTILSCQIKNNPFGVLDSFGSGLLMQHSVIENNNIGLYLKGPNQYISCNKICNNSAYDFYYNSTSSTFTAENNYWCSTDAAIISSHIYDGYDNINLGLVDFSPFDITQCYLTTGIPFNEVQNFSFNIFPNPIIDKLNITTNNNELSEIILYDISSRKLIQQKFTNSVTLNTAQLAKGIYIYEVSTKNEVIKTGKVVKE